MDIVSDGLLQAFAEQLPVGAVSVPLLQVIAKVPPESVYPFLQFPEHDDPSKI